MLPRALWMSASALCVAATAAAATIDTQFFDRPWPRQWTHRYEVGRHMVDWRQGGSRAEGTFAQARCAVPLPRQTVWTLSTDFPTLWRMTPAVKAFRILEQQPAHQVVEIDLHVFWKTVRLTFAVDYDPPRAMQFRLIDHIAGTCQGICTFTEEPPTRRGATAASATTTVELLMWVKPTRHIPMRLLWFVERTTILQGIKAFLAACDVRDPTIPPRKHERRIPSGHST